MTCEVMDEVRHLPDADRVTATATGGAPGAAAASRAPGRTVGLLLRHWRERRRLSQLELSNRAEVSTRHLSYVETGRSAPSREMLLHLAEHLEMPLRERNSLLLAGGFAPVYPESGLDAPQLSAIRRAVGQVLSAHEPYPAVVVDRYWNVVDGNRSLGLFLDGAAPELLAPPVNVLRLALAPAGMAPKILNLGEWRAHLLGRLRRQVEFSGDGQLAALLDELRGYPCDQAEPEVEMPGPGDVVVPLRVRGPDAEELTFFSTVSTFGTPLDITVAELVIESFFPADTTTATALRAFADA
jgi:transcriptional regulator with XRE-family HTH domain